MAKKKSGNLILWISIVLIVLGGYYAYTLTTDNTFSISGDKDIEGVLDSFEEDLLFDEDLNSIGDEFGGL